MHLSARSPVDVCAEAIAATACAQPPIPGHATYHVCNAYTGGDVVSLDTILGWVATAGYPVERIAPYELWLKRFKQALELLDARRRGVTPLQTLQLWERPVSADGVMCALPQPSCMPFNCSAVPRGASRGLNQGMLVMCTVWVLPWQRVCR